MILQSIAMIGALAFADPSNSMMTGDLKPVLVQKVKELEGFHENLEKQINQLIERTRSPAEKQTDSELSKKIEDLQAKANAVFQQYAIARGVLSAVTISGENVDSPFIEKRLEQIGTDLARTNTDSKSTKKRSIAADTAVKESLQSLEAEKRFWDEFKALSNAKKP
jgi:hypothetical protein